MRKNDKKVIAAAAAAAGLPPGPFTVEESYGYVLVNHPEAMKWSPERCAAIKSAVAAITGMKVTIT